MSEIIFLTECKRLKSEYYAAWPGDEEYELEKSQDESDEHEPLITRPPSFRLSREPVHIAHVQQHNYFVDSKCERPHHSTGNRYFSRENIAAISEQTCSPVVETSQPKHGFWLRKILKSNSFDEETNSAESGSTCEEEQTCRKLPYLDEFIPLVGHDTTRNKRHMKASFYDEYSSDESDCVEVDSADGNEVKILIKKMDPSVNSVEDYRGPYPIKCLLNVRQNLINEFAFEATNRLDMNKAKEFEILKMKMNMKSKYDRDNSIWRRIRVQTYETREKMHLKVLRRDERLKQFFDKNKVKSNDDEVIVISDNDNLPPKTAIEIIELD